MRNSTGLYQFGRTMQRLVLCSFVAAAPCGFAQQKPTAKPSSPPPPPAIHSAPPPQRPAQNAPTPRPQSGQPAHNSGGFQRQNAPAGQAQPGWQQQNRGSYNQGTPNTAQPGTNRGGFGQGQTVQPGVGAQNQPGWQQQNRGGFNQGTPSAVQPGATRGGFGQGAPNATQPGTQRGGFGQGPAGQPSGERGGMYGAGQPNPQRPMQQGFGGGRGNGGPSWAGPSRVPTGGTQSIRANGSVIVHDRSGRPTEVRSADGGLIVHPGANGRPNEIIRNQNGVYNRQVMAPGHLQYVETVRSGPGGNVRTVMYGPNRVMVEKSIMGRPGFMRQSYLDHGRQYAVVYRGYSYRGVAFYRPVPPVIYAPGFYAWGLRPWGAPVSYQWGWRSAAWFGAYGSVFTPYPQYDSLDLWMTDYVISQNLRSAYEAGQASMQGGPGPESYGPSPQPYYDGQPQGPGMEAGAAPPVITPELKAEIAAQVRVEMEEQQLAAAQGANNVAPPPSDQPVEDLPDALKDGHVTFRVHAPLTVQAGGQQCSLSPDDYLHRAGTLTDDNTVPVVVKASRSSDCAVGATTMVALNDLMTMEDEQQRTVTAGTQVAALNVGRNGLPRGPNPGATPVPLGQAVPDADLAMALQQQKSQAAANQQYAAGLGVNN